jgi:peroxiredoxin
MTGPWLVSYGVLWVLVGLQLVAIFALYHHFGELYFKTPEGREAQGPKVGISLSRKDMFSLAADRVTVPDLGASTVLVFASTKCPLCSRLRPDLAEFARESREVRTLVICSGDREAVEKWATELDGAVPVIPDPGHHLAMSYDVSILPYCVGIDDAGVVRSAGLINTQRGLREAAELALMRRSADAIDGNVIELEGAL